MPSTLGVLLSLVWDGCCAPPLQAAGREWSRLRAGLLADARQLRMHGVLRRKPEKGLLRIVLALGWLAIHLFVLITFLLYGAFEAGPVHASWWLVTTLLAGVGYVCLMYSDPGFIGQEMLEKMTAGLDLGVNVVRNDGARGLLQDVEGELPAMESILPSTEEGGEGADKREGLLAAADADERKHGKGKMVYSLPKQARVETDEWNRAPRDHADTQAKEAGPSEVRLQVEGEEPVSSAARHKPPPRARIAPCGGTKEISTAASGDVELGHSGREEGGKVGEGEGDEHGQADEELRRALAINPRMVGVHSEMGEAEVEVNLLLPCRLPLALLVCSSCAGRGYH